MGTMAGWDTRRMRADLMDAQIRQQAADLERERIRFLLEQMAADPVTYFATPKRLSRRGAQSHALLEAARRL